MPRGRPRAAASPAALRVAATAATAATTTATAATNALPSVAEADAGTTSALTRLLQIIDLFTLERTMVRVDEVAETFGIVQSTAYRYLRELSDVGLLAPQGKGVYALGRRIVELERILQLSDPLLLAGKGVLDTLDTAGANRAFLLCTFHRDGALCVHKVGPDEIQFNSKAMKIQRGRGTLLPLFSGAGSQVILANLPAHQIKALYLANGRQIAAAGIGETWKEFRSYLADIRKRGFAETTGKMNPGMHSVAVPILRAEGKVAGSLLMLGAASAPEMAEALGLVPLLQDKAAAISAGMTALEPEGGRD